MNKTIWQVLITGAVAELIMLGTIILRHIFTWANLANGYLYVFAVMFFYLSVLRIFKSYKAALILSLIAAMLPLSGNFIYQPYSLNYIVSALFCAMSFFAYTFTDAQGLKHNQYKHFLLLSLFLYISALSFSMYASVLPLAIFIYEIVGRRNNEVKPLKKKIYSFFLITFLAIIIKLFAY